MKMAVDLAREGTTFLEQVEARSGEKVAECYQCGKCSGGCPFSSLMDIAPNQILEMIYYGLEEPLLRSRAIRTCIGCGTCEANCPAGFKMYRVMETLRHLAREKGVEPKADAGIVSFNRLFLDNVARFGRLQEIGLALEYNRKKGQLLRDSAMGARMFFKGMVGAADLFPRRSATAAPVGRIFRKIEEMEGRE